ncbi:MAG: hypothetical protein JWN99_2572 [Ilumatobacteraceae bacterium]|nr:hypothetical protein [Ilumatobacteraceae bacterium]
MDAETLTITRVTKDMGTVIKTGPMVVAGPEQVVTDKLLGDVAQGSGLNGPLLTDLIASMATHENMAIGMYRALRTTVANPMLVSVFEQFEADSLAAVEVHIVLMDALSIPWPYVGPAGRMTEDLDSHMIMSLLGSGSADPVTIDLKAVEMVFLGATMCVANTDLLRQIGEAGEGDARAAILAAVAELEGLQVQHLEWARQTRSAMALTMVQHPIAHKLTRFAETVVAKMTGKQP